MQWNQEGFRRRGIQTGKDGGVDIASIKGRDGIRGRQ